MEKWKTIHTRSIRHDSLTLSELKKLISEVVPEGMNDEDINLNFEIEDYDEYNLYGDKYTVIESNLEIQIRDK